MLVLSRRVGEQIVIPPFQLTMTVLEIDGNQVRLGITAPAEVPVNRDKIANGPQSSGGRAQDQEEPDAAVRVMIADGDAHLAATYREYLEEHGFEVVTACNGLECLERLREHPVEVLVLDPSMPWGGGDGVLAVIHEEPKLRRIPVVVLTYGRDRRVLYQLAPYRVADYLVKPMTARRLSERILSVLGKRPRRKHVSKAGS